MTDTETPLLARRRARGGWKLPLLGAAVCLTIGFLALSGPSTALQLSLDPINKSLPRQRGFVLPLRDSRSAAESLACMRAAGANAVVIAIENPQTPELPEAVRLAQDQHGMRVWLALAVRTKEAQIYASLARGTASRAASLKAYGLAVGWGVDPALFDEGGWKAIFGILREAAPDAKLMFVSDRENYPWIGWWEAVDAIGVTGEFPLTARKAATQSEIASSWRTHFSELESFASQFNRPAVILDHAPKGGWLGPRFEAFVEESRGRGEIEGVFPQLDPQVAGWPQK